MLKEVDMDVQLYDIIEKKRIIVNNYEELLDEIEKGSNIEFCFHPHLMLQAA